MSGQASFASISWNDIFRMRLNRLTALQLSAGDTPRHLNHYLARYTGNGMIDHALRFGLFQLDAPHVGGASPYRFGTPGDARSTGRCRSSGCARRDRGVNMLGGCVPTLDFSVLH